MIIYLHTLYSLVAILKEQQKKKEKKRNDDKQKKIWEKWTECRRRGVKVWMINILDSFIYNIVQHRAELGAED